MTSLSLVMLLKVSFIVSGLPVPEEIYPSVKSLEYDLQKVQRLVEKRKVAHSF